MKKICFATILTGFMMLSSCQTVNTFEVKMHASGGTFGSNNQDLITIPTNEGNLINYTDTVSKKGHTFAGWYTSSSYQDEWIIDEDVVTANTDLFAKWDVNTYTLNLTNSDPTKGNISEDGSYTYDSSVSLTATPETGYSFAGWYDNETLVSKSSPYTFNMPDHNVNLNAKWDVNTYTVTLVNNFTDKGSVTGEGEYQYGSSITINATPLEGYSFAGWYDENESLISNENEYTFVIGANDVTYYAKFGVLACNLSIDLADERLTTLTGDESGSYGYGKTATLSIDNNLPNKYKFVGWYDGEGNKLSDQPTYSLTVPSVPSYSVTAEFSYDFSDFTIEDISNTNNFKVTKYLGTNPEVILGGAYFDEDGVKHTCTSLSGKGSTNVVFSGDTVETLSMPDSITGLSYVFLGNTNLKNLHIEGDTYIYGSNFMDLVNLEHITVGKHSQYYHEEFKDYNIVVGTLGSKTTIDLGCKNSIIPEGIGYISSYAFYKRDIEELEIPSSLTGIGSKAFQNCSKLRSVTSKDNDNRFEVNELAFYGCTSLEEALLPKHTSYLGKESFEKCSALTKLDMGEGAISQQYRVNAICDYAVSYCSSLTKIIIPTGFTEICKYAFFDSYNIRYVFIPITVTAIDNINAFYVANNHLNNFIFYLEAPSRPDGWPSNFDSYFYPHTYYNSTPDYD